MTKLEAYYQKENFFRHRDRKPRCHESEREEKPGCIKKAAQRSYHKWEICTSGRSNCQPVGERSYTALLS